MVVTLKKGDIRLSAFFVFVVLIVSLSLISAADVNETLQNGTITETTYQNVTNESQNVINISNDQNIALSNESETNVTQQEPQPEQTANNSILQQNTTELLNQTVNEQPLVDSQMENETPQLAQKINSISIDTQYIREYLDLYKNFSDVPYKKLKANSTDNAILAVGAKEDNIRGIELSNKRYAVHLILCNHNTRECAFRINGVATGPLATAEDDQAKAPSKFDLDENATLQINSIQMDYCDGRRFCNVYYEAYDIVNLTVLVK